MATHKARVKKPRKPRKKRIPTVTMTFMAKVLYDAGVWERIFITHKLLNEGDGMSHRGLQDVCSVMIRTINCRYQNSSFLEHPERRNLLSSWMKAVLMTGAQDGLEVFSKATQAYDSDVIARNTLLSLKKKLENRLTKLSDAVQVEQTRKDLQAVIEAITCHDLFQPPIGKPWYPMQSLREKFAGMGNFLYRQYVMQAIAHVASYIGGKKTQKAKAQDRLQRRDEWIRAKADHAAYFKLRKLFVDLEKSTGILMSRVRLESEEYYNWLVNHPELLAWRGKSEVELVRLDQQTEEKLKSYRGRGKREYNRRKLLKLFNLNPELSALDKVHGEYESLFTVRRQRKLQPDDWVDYPGFSLPDVWKHPRSLVTSAPQTQPTAWWNLEFPTAQSCPVGDTREAGHPVLDKHGRITLLTFAQQGEDGVDREKTTVWFIPDKRFFSRFHSRDPEHPGYKCLYWDPKLNKDRIAIFAGVRLRLENIQGPQSFDLYLDFVVDLEAVQGSELGREVRWSAKKVAKATPPTVLTDSYQLRKLNLKEGTVVGSVIIDPSSVAWVSVYQVGKEMCLTHFHTRKIDSRKALSSKNFQKRQDRFFRNMRWSGGKQPGQRFAIERQNELNNVSDQRIREGASSVVNFLLGQDQKIRSTRVKGEARVRYLGLPVDVILIGSSLSLKVNPRNAGGSNRSLAGFSAMSLIEKIEAIAKNKGKRTFVLKRSGYDRCCAKCGALGLRYAIKPGKKGKSQIVFANSGENFFCPSCRFQANSLHNAAHGLIRSLMDPSTLKAHRELKNLPEAELQKTEEELQARVLPEIAKSAML